MRIKGLFWILTALLLSVLAIITYHAFYTESVSLFFFCLLYTSPSPRDRQKSRMPSSA